MHAVLAEVEVAVAVELNDAAGHRLGVGAELVVVDRLRSRDEQDAPARVSQPPAEVGLVGVDEEVAVEPADLLRGLAPYQHGARLHPADLTHVASPALNRHALVAEDRGRQRPGNVRQAPRAGGRLSVAREQQRAGGRRAAVGSERVQQRARGAVAQLRVLVQQQAVAPLAPPSAAASRCPPCPRAARAQTGARRDDDRGPPRLSRRRRRCRARAPRVPLRPGACARSRPGSRAGTRARSCSPRSRTARSARRLLEDRERPGRQLVAARTRAPRGRARCGPSRAASSGLSRSHASFSARSLGVAGAHVQPGLVVLHELAHPAVHVHDGGPPRGERVEELVGGVGREHRHVLEERQAGARLAPPAAPRRPSSRGGSRRSAVPSARAARAACRRPSARSARPARAAPLPRAAVRSFASPIAPK